MQVHPLAEHLAPQAVPLAGGRAEERLRPGLALGEDRRQALIVLRGTPHPRRLLPEQPPEATGGGVEALERHAVEPARALGPGGHPPIVGQHLQVPAHRRLRELQHRAQIGDGELVALDEPERAGPRRVGERAHPAEHGGCGSHHTIRRSG